MARAVIFRGLRTLGDAARAHARGWRLRGWDGNPPFWQTWFAVKEVDVGFHVIGLSGRAGAGKDTVADHLVKEYGYTKLSFAAPLKRMVALALAAYPPPQEVLALLPRRGGAGAWSWQELVHTVKPPFARWLLQFVGTDLFRAQVDRDFWVRLASSDLEWHRDSGRRVVFSDIRFENEAGMIRAAGGEVWRIDRTGFQPGQESGHESETLMDGYAFDRILSAPTGPHHLHALVDAIMLEASHAGQKEGPRP